MGADAVGYLAYDGGRPDVGAGHAPRAERSGGRLRRGGGATCATCCARCSAVTSRRRADTPARYVVDAAAGTVTHRIDCALLPVQVGAELTRWCEIDGTRLTLFLSPPATDGPRTGGRVAWERLD